MPYTERLKSPRQSRDKFINPDMGDTYQYKYLGTYLPDVEVFNCPSTGFKRDDEYAFPQGIYTYQEMYERGYHELPSTGMSCSYLLFWNYEAYNKTNMQAQNSNNEHDKPFIGPGRKSKNTLLIADSFFFTNNLGPYDFHWASNHNYKGASKGTDGFEYYLLPVEQNEDADFANNQALRSISLNAGYTDGSVQRFKSADTIRQQAVTGYAASYIPLKWK